MKPEILSRQFIQPSAPTPPHLKTYKFSLLDQLSTAIHGNITFFFSPNSNNTHISFSNKSQLIQTSLSNTLTIFYPLAGRISDASTVDCNDKGAFFMEAKIDITLSEFLNQPNVHESLDPLLPSSDLENMELAKGSLLIIQFTGFSCGGVAMSLSSTHKITDMATLLIFLHSWAAVARDTEPYLPQWTGASLLPPRDDLIPSMTASLSISSRKFIAKRFVFSAEKIAKLKAKAIGFGDGLGYHPSKVEVVLALIWKCAIASHKAKSGSFKPSAIFQAVNLRKRMSPPLPDTTMGNFIWPFMVLVEEEKEVELHELVIKMRKAFNDFCDHKANKFIGEQGCLTALEGLKERKEFFNNKKELNVYTCTSWCKFPLYGTDFGWGEPVWHTSVNRIVSNTISLSDTRSGDGIEAILTLDGEEMTTFESNVELLEFASLNPSVIV